MPPPELVPDQGFTEVADRVWVARYSTGDAGDVNVALVEGARGLLLVDSLDSERAGHALVEDIRRVSRLDVVALVSTSSDADHVGGNAVVRQMWPALGTHAHEDAARGIEGVDHTFNSVQVIDLGDRAAELIHPGRGHTAGDLVVRLADAEVLVAGDVVAAGTPAYGPGSFPLEWATALDFVVGLVTPTWVVVPGHGSLVDQPFVTGQRSGVGTVAETVFDLASRRVPLEDALAQPGWPYPAELLAEAVKRGYEQVPRTARRLPLV
jgi:glyoxylase-like metal-dependent hydrolase (beta-lactamase superfamily II)